MNETYLKTCPDCETYIIEMVGGVKHAHYNGYVYGCDDGKGWKAQEMTWCYAPVVADEGDERSLFERLCHEVESKQQYACDDQRGDEDGGDDNQRPVGFLFRLLCIGIDFLLLCF